MECSDQGALFVTAQVDCTMDELIMDQPKFQQFRRLGSSSRFSEDGSFHVSVQFNAFSCGGMAILFCFSHKNVDITSIAMFLKCWASISCGSQESGLYPEYVSALVFPPRDYIPYDFSVVYKGLLVNEGRSIRKRFVFSAAAVAGLKTEGSSERVPDPTSVEVVSSFVWKHAMEAAKIVKGIQQPSILIHAVDLRRRMVPPLPDYSAGNLVWLMVAEYGSQSDDELWREFRELVEILRLAKQTTKDVAVPNVESSEGYNEMDKFLEELGDKCGNKDMNVYQFSSWCKMGLNEVDFGWGKPIWTSLVGGVEGESFLKNFEILIDGSDGGIEAWLLLEQGEMVVLESDQEFLTYASPNPSFTISM